MLKEEAVNFLKKSPPFNVLPTLELKRLAREIRLDYFPAGQKVLSQNGSPVKYAGLIKKGVIKVSRKDPNGMEMLIGFRNEGETFGVLSLINGDRSRADMIAIEDSICYLLPKENILSILQAYPAVKEFFLKFSLLTGSAPAFDNPGRRHQESGDHSHLPLSTAVGRIVKRKPVTAKPDCSIQQAARLMADHRISSIIAVDDNDYPIGILTDRDLRIRVVAAGISIQNSISTVMTQPVHTIQAGESCFDLLLQMMRHNIHHVLIMDEDEFLGMVTNHDLMLLLGTEPSVLARELGRLETEGLPQAVENLQNIAIDLLRERAASGEVCGLLTNFMTKLINRTVGIIEKKLGPPPVPYLLFFLDDGARSELTLRFEIRLGIFIDTQNRPDLTDVESAYFHELAHRINRLLNTCLVSEERLFLAKEYIKTHAAWIRTIENWLITPGDESKAIELIDIKPLQGNSRLIDSFRHGVFNRIAYSPAILRRCVEQMVDKRPPVGFYRQFVVTGTGEHQDGLDLYHQGIKPISTLVGLLIIADKTDLPVNTIDRLAFLGDNQLFGKAAELAKVFHYLLTELLLSQTRAVAADHSVDSLLRAKELSLIERKTVTQAFQLIAELQDHLWNTLKRQEFYINDPEMNTRIS